MSATLIVGQGILQPARTIEFDPQQGGREGCALLLSDQFVPNEGGVPQAQNQWIVELGAQGKQGFARLGRVLTNPPNGTTEPNSRVIAIGCCPGARGWVASVRGPKGQRAYFEMISGEGVGNGVPGITMARPRPRDFAHASGLGGGRVATPWDTTLLSVSVSYADGAGNPGAWFQTFNTSVAPVAGMAPLFSRFVPIGGFFDLAFDYTPEVGDPRYTIGYAWSVSTNPIVLAPAVTTLSVISVLG
jgi:hypothetical protein